MSPFLIFYGKPVCKTNKKQIAQLKSLEIPLIVNDLLKTPWTETELCQYFGATDKSLWVNTSAPQIKNAELDLETISEGELLHLMVDNPILIRRPLIKFGDQRTAGFDLKTIIALYDGNISAVTPIKRHKVEICSRVQGHT